MDRVDVIGASGGESGDESAPPAQVVITDYKSSDVRDPARAKERARDSLQLQIYALAYQAESGRPPDAVQLWFLESGWWAGSRWTPSGSTRLATRSGA